VFHVRSLAAAELLQQHWPVALINRPLRKAAERQGEVIAFRPAKTSTAGRQPPHPGQGRHWFQPATAQPT